MEDYPRLFIKAGLIYALLGAVLGIAMAIEPALAGRVRFVHIHLNLLGFMTMFVAGVAFHVLPRFNANPVPWPAGVKYQFYLQNTGLIGMVALAVATPWRDMPYRALFILFALMAAVAIAFMFYNLYFVLRPAQPASARPEKITGDMKVSEVLQHFPQSMPLFLQAGFTALKNPAARQTFAKVVSVEKACEKHGVDAEQFLRSLNAQLLGKTPAAPEPNPIKPAETAGVGEGKEITKGEACAGDTRVGSLIAVYPATKAVFEKHYGEGCFSCPGQIYETVGQTAQMHNIDPNLILSEINAVIADENRK